MLDTISYNIDLVDIGELHAYMQFQAGEAFPSLRDEGKLQTFASKLFNNAEFCLCRDNGLLVGMIAFYANGKGADFAYIPHIYVSPEFRQRGIFSHMLDMVVSYVKEKGFHEIRLEVDKLNIRAQNSYLKKGFEIIPSYNLCIDSFYMRKML